MLVEDVVNPGLKLTFCTLIIISTIVYFVIASDQYTLNSPPDENSQKLITGLYQSLYNAIEMDSVKEVKQFVAFGANIDYRY